MTKETPVTRRGGTSTTLVGLLAVLVYAFLYFPMIVVAIFAFATNTTQTLPIEGFTFRWFLDAIGDDVLVTAFRNSVLVALAAVTLSTVLGVPAAILVDRYRFPGKVLFQKFILLPLVLPGVVTGVAFQSFFLLIGLPRSLGLVALAHGTALTSTVLTTVYARLLRSDPAMEEASMDLGMNRLQTFWHVTLPGIRTSVIAAALLTFTLSFDEIPVTIFITGDGGNTLPMVLWSTLRRESRPEYVAFTVVVLLVGVLVVTLASKVLDDRPPVPIAEAGG